MDANEGEGTEEEKHLSDSPQVDSTVLQMNANLFPGVAPGTTQGEPELLA